MYKDTRLGGIEKWYYRPPKDADMRIPDAILHSVAFVCLKSTKPGVEKYFPIGTVFFTGVNEGDATFLYLVTADHVLGEAKRAKAEKVYIRLNKSSGGVEYFPIDTEDPMWHRFVDANIDLVALHVPFDSETFLINYLPIDMCVTPDLITKYLIGHGDDIFLAGLFNANYGQARNFPIIRSGLISAMPLEPIPSKSGIPFAAYLCEVRSIRGLSGSPVFIHLTKDRYPTPDFGEENIRSMILLLGVVRGHWDLKDASDDSANPEEEFLDAAIGFSKGENLNTGIALVTPAYQLHGLLMHNTMKKMRESTIERLESDDVVVEDSVVPTEFTSTDFDAALRMASRKVSSPDRETKETSG